MDWFPKELAFPDVFCSRISTFLQVFLPNIFSFMFISSTVWEKQNILEVIHAITKTILLLHDEYFCLFNHHLYKWWFMNEGKDFFGWKWTAALSPAQVPCELHWSCASSLGSSKVTWRLAELPWSSRDAWDTETWAPLCLAHILALDLVSTKGNRQQVE